MKVKKIEVDYIPDYCIRCIFGRLENVSGKEIGVCLALSDFYHGECIYKQYVPMEVFFNATFERCPLER